jgi:hypothetical protein
MPPLREQQHQDRRKARLRNSRERRECQKRYADADERNKAQPRNEGRAHTVIAHQIKYLRN